MGLRHRSSTGVEVLRNGDLTFRVELASPHQHPLSLAEVDPAAVEVFESHMAVAFGEPQKQALHNDIDDVGFVVFMPLEVRNTRSAANADRTGTCLTSAPSHRALHSTPINRLRERLVVQCQSLPSCGCAS